MDKMYFECTALDSIVIRSRASTEGANGSLKYIPGNAFLGIVAKNYKNFAESFDIFHSGKVIFGDGHLAQNGHRSLKSPLNWFYNKGEKIQNSRQLEEEKITIFNGNLDVKNQKKQVRDIFFFSDGSTIECEEFYSLKSAYNQKQRKSNDGQMYGYHALPCGTKWIFYVKGENKYLKQIRSSLEKRHSIGKSKSAQYGRVEIKCLEDYTDTWKSEEAGNLVYIYAESLLAFVNKHGQPTYMPTVQDFDIEQGEIDWKRSQVRPYTYSPYNGKRCSRDTDRICIDKGSVFVIKINENIGFDFDNYCKKVEKGIGIYKNEGMGQILVNPTFLLGEHPAFSEQLEESRELNHSYQSSLDKHSSDEVIEQWLSQKTIKSDAKQNIAGKVNDFMGKNAKDFFISGEKENITSSQWGGIRSYAESSRNYEQLYERLFEENKSEQEKGGFLKRGKMKNTWQKNDRVEILKNFIADVQKTSKGNYSAIQGYLVELCSEMAKFSKVGG